MIWVGLGLALACLAFMCMTVASWHSKESDYWHHVSLLVMLDPEQDKEYRPLLEWAQTHRPTIWQRLRKWEPPEVRRTRAWVSS